MMEAEELTRVGIMIQRYGSWRETVERYAGYKNLEQSCLAMFDSLVCGGMMEPWAALHALDAHCCADIVMNSEHTSVTQVASIN